MVTPPKAVYDRIRAENRIIAQARTRDTAQDLFESGWVWPAIGRISGVYGSQRVLNGKPRRPHYGIDIAAPTGTPVVSPADAIVAMIHHDMYYTGRTIILDHGHGLTSAMLHMDRINVREGDRVRKARKSARSAQAAGRPDRISTGASTFSKRVSTQPSSCRRCQQRKDSRYSFGQRRCSQNHCSGYSRIQFSIILLISTKAADTSVFRSPVIANSIGGEISTRK